MAYEQLTMPPEVDMGQTSSEIRGPTTIIPVEMVQRLGANSLVNSDVETAGPPDLWCSPCKIFVRQKCSAPNCAAS
jgi:hypothetical protein